MNAVIIALLQCAVNCVMVCEFWPNTSDMSYLLYTMWFKYFRKYSMVN